LFRPDQLDQKVGDLSGGERMRLLLAKLLLAGANVILLDEPTNDLDLKTLRILEEALIAFDGASLVISHDRALLDRACTAVLSFEGDGKVVRYASRLQAVVAQENAAAVAPVVVKDKATKSAKAAPVGLTWSERKELDALPAQLETLEAERDRLGALLADPSIYQATDGKAAELGTSFKAAETAVSEAYARWEALEARA